MEEENPLVIATGTFAVVADQEVKAAIVGVVLGVLLVEVLELSPPPQATRKKGVNTKNEYFIEVILWLPSF